MGVGEADTRETMHRYWEYFNPSMESMMLDPRAHILNEDENSEILSFLPDITGKSVLELGAGIGRFTGKLAARAGHVTAVDFMASYVEHNRQRNGHMPNIEFHQADVVVLELPAKRFDIVFSNWLCMYLNDQECKQLFEKILGWLKDDGQVFLRESCYKPSGDTKRSTNPTYYRSPAQYYDMIRASHLHEGDTTFLFVMNKVANVRAYIKHKNNPCQVCFLASKMGTNGPVSEYITFQEFLDKRQYTQNSVRLYEWIFGETFLSSGGLPTTQEIVQKMHIKDGDRILDVGCGIGGHDFYMAENYDVQILAVDLSVNMMSVALEHFSKRPHLTKKIQFEVVDATQVEYEEGSFDIIYSRDTLLHIADKKSLFQKFHRWLSPGGKLVFTDYCRGDQEHSEEFKTYVADRGYNLLTVQQYNDLMDDTGFVNVRCENYSKRFLEVLVQELEKLSKEKEDFLNKFTH
ncbi:uncharacterized protein LOC135374559 isoform X2 [Ornithodoros turicata]|uniref:uncharacterized protein LOC135374559 isoform X2 n=1 Tax=Ornithodoros turicata TaxID=34597 RepID=UPI0031392999